MTKRELIVSYYQSIEIKEEELNILLLDCPANPIDQVPWKAFPYKPDVEFKIAYSDKAFVLKYQVREKHLRINNFQTNSGVWEDSCVELFISFQKDYYYNIEFNALGVGLIGYGTRNRGLRTCLPNHIVEKIRSFSTIKRSIYDPLINWSLTLYIPIDVFYYERIKSLKGLMCKANFYKGGDLLPEPHYLSWSPVLSATPNFHLPESFGRVFFEP